MLSRIKEISFWKIIILVGTGFFSSVVQIYCFPDAGKNVQDKSYAYSFQMNVWAEEIHQKFNEIKKSGTIKKLSLATGKKTLTHAYLSALSEYHFQVTELIRILNFQGNTAANMVADTTTLLEKAIPQLNSIDQEAIQEKYKIFTDLSKESIHRKKEIEEFLPKLKAAFFQNSETLSHDKKIQATIEQLNLISKIYSDESLFLKHNFDNFSFVRDYANASEGMLFAYKELVETYNKRVSTELVYKNALLILILMIGFYVSFLKENHET